VAKTLNNSPLQIFHKVNALTLTRNIFDNKKNYSKMVATLAYPKVVWMPEPWFTYSMVSQVVH